MAERQMGTNEATAGPTHPPPLTVEQFRASPEFRRLRVGMKKLLRVSKADLDRRLIAAKERSPRTGNPNAPGRKPKKPDA